MEITMSETTTETTTTAETAGETSADTSKETSATDATTTAEGETALGDAGKKALDAMKAERAAARKEAAEVKAKLDALQAKLDGKEAEHAAAQEKAATEAAALAKANDRILRSEVKAAAKGVLADPADAYKFLDLSTFEVDDDGNVDEGAIAKALADLVAEKPYLAVQDGKRFQGGADGGTRKESVGAQLSQADLQGMSPEQIVAAKAEGRLNNLLGIK